MALLLGWEHFLTPLKKKRRMVSFPIAFGLKDQEALRDLHRPLIAVAPTALHHFLKIPNEARSSI
jgi:hypothetical protein